MNRWHDEEKGFTGDMLLWLLYFFSFYLSSADIQNMHRVKKKLLGSCRAALRLKLPYSVSRKEKKIYPSLNLEKKKSYIHVDNDVKFIMYKSSKSFTVRKKVIVFVLPTLAKKK